MLQYICYSLSDKLLAMGGCRCRDFFHYLTSYNALQQAMHNGKEIAVKKFHQLEGRLDDKEFDNEVLNLREIEHQNIVRLLGYCYVSEHRYIERKGMPSIRAEHVDRVLCFEYMQGSLDKHISGIIILLEHLSCMQIVAVLYVCLFSVNSR